MRKILPTSSPENAKSFGQLQLAPHLKSALDVGASVGGDDGVAVVGALVVGTTVGASVGKPVPLSKGLKVGVMVGSDVGDKVGIGGAPSRIQ